MKSCKIKYYKHPYMDDSPIYKEINCKVYRKYKGENWIFQWFGTPRAPGWNKKLEEITEKEAFIEIL